jgi:cystathionine gamma-synthase/cystathionine gamma-lyase/cystathionine beta-lyase
LIRNDRVHGTLETNLLHAGRAEPNIEGAVVAPVFQTANYLMGEESEYGQVRYIRLNNSPNHQILHARLAAVEGTETALVTSSGMAAITSTIFAFVQAGEHVLAHESLYGGAQSWFAHDAARFGITHTPVDATREAGWEAALRPETKLFYVEGITNPLMQVLDLEAVVRFARRHRLVTVIDNTFPTPVNFQPARLGIDVVLHSATKYLNGHSDIVAGAVAGSRAHVDRIRHVVNHMGGALDPHACFLLERGLKTLALRVERQNQNALRLARFLAEHPKVRRVNYPGLPGDPGHERAKRLFRGFGGMLSFYTHTAEQATRLLERLRIPLHAASLGAVESLVVRPSRSSHLGFTPEERARMGVGDDLVRVSMGIESADELLADFEQALESA